MDEIEESYDDCWINEWKANDTSNMWVIEGLLCPQLTLLSGQPKMGKSTLAGHIAMSLISNQPILGRSVNAAERRVAWMGFDGGWRNETTNRWNDKSLGQIKMLQMRGLNPFAWEQLGEQLKDQGIGLLVIDHLYGLAGTINLNDAAEAAQVLMCIRPIYEKYGIPILLIAQSTKSEFSQGKAAHSNRIMGEARSLLQLYGKGKEGRRRLKVEANNFGDTTLSIVINPNECILQDGRIGNGSVDRTSPDIARKLLTSAGPEELLNATAAGRAMVRLGLAKTDNAGRTAINRLRTQQLLELTPQGIIRGEKLIA